MSYYENRIKSLEEKVAEMAKRERMKAIPVEAQLLDSIARLKAEVDNSNRINTELLLLSNKQASEVRRLTAELSNISGWGRGLESDLSHARVEISFLKTEVERLTERNKFLEQIDSYLQGANENAYEKRCDELEAEVERLTKAHSDALADFWAIHKGYFDLKAEVEQLRKEGKPSV